MDLESVAKIMSPTPVVVEPEAPLGKVWRLMAEHRVRHIPVVSAAGLVGVISDRDVREALPSPWSGATELGAVMDRIAAWEVMVEQVITVTPQTPVAQAAKLLAGRKIGCLPVLEAGQLVGIVTETDMLQAFAGLLDDLSGSPRFELAVADTPGRLQQISRLFADLPSDVGIFVGAWTAPASPEEATGRVLVLRFQAFKPQQILRVLDGADIQVLSLGDRPSDVAGGGPVSDTAVLK